MRMSRLATAKSSFPTGFKYRTFASSAPSGIVPQLIEEFGFGEEVATLTISLFVAGYCIGPLLCDFPLLCGA